jgi:uncharacterized protein (UPF0333 family)
MKGQASMEYMLLFSLTLLIVGILWVISNGNIDNTQWELHLANVKNALEKIVHNADIVYLQGPPARVYIDVYLPETVEAIYIEGTSVTMEMKWRGTLRNITDYSIANLTGVVTPLVGRQRILIRAGTPLVNITDA